MIDGHKNGRKSAQSLVWSAQPELRQRIERDIDGRDKVPISVLRFPVSDWLEALLLCQSSFCQSLRLQTSRSLNCA